MSCDSIWDECIKREAAVRSSNTMAAHSEQPKWNEYKSSILTALMVDGDYGLEFYSERYFDDHDHGYSKTID